MYGILTSPPLFLVVHPYAISLVLSYVDVISYVDIVKPENSAKKTADPLSASAVTASFNDAKKLYYDKLKAKNKTATAVVAPAPAPLFALPTFFHDFDQA